MTETCKRCGRPVDNDAPLVERCIREGSFSCLQIEAAYRRGILRGVELAKRTAYPSRCHRHEVPPKWNGEIEWDRAHCGDCGEEVDWTETDREAAELAGEER